MTQPSISEKTKTKKWEKEELLASWPLPQRLSVLGSLIWLIYTCSEAIERKR